MGVWDDHDYGINNGGDDYPFKDRNRDLWLDFIDEGPATERRLDRGSAIH